MRLSLPSRRVRWAASVAAAAIVVACGGSDPVGIVPEIPGPDTCAVARPDFGPAATAADRALFAYNAKAPLNLQTTVESTSDGIEISKISYTSPDGGSVPGIIAVPLESPAPRPGIVVMHPSGFPATIMQGYAKLVAHRGAVVIGIDAPYFRRGGNSLPRFIPADRLEHIQLIKDLQRAVDVLLARPDVDASRIGFEGYSFGAMIGAHFVGIEKRLKVAVIQAGYGGQVTHATNDVNKSFLVGNVSCGTRNAWFRDMVPIEPIRFIPGASPTTLLFQIATADNAVLPADAKALYDVAPNPKEVLYYDTGHNFNAQAMQDRHNWLAKQLGLE